MKLSLHSRLLIVCVALFGMLFMQLSVAATVCPMLYSAVQVMPDCDGMDMPHLTPCQTHAAGDAVKQSPDKSELPQIQPFVSGQLVQEIQLSDYREHALAAPLAQALSNYPLSPPVAILHCCFRI